MLREREREKVLQYLRKESRCQQYIEHPNMRAICHAGENCGYGTERSQMGIIYYIALDASQENTKETKSRDLRLLHTIHLQLH